MNDRLEDPPTKVLVEPDVIRRRKLYVSKSVHIARKAAELIQLEED